MRLLSAFIIVSALCLLSCNTELSYTEYTDCTIYRDQWGVPHIHGKTDGDVAYGLAWASCEDDFNTLQEQMLALKGKYGEVKGKDGIIADFAIQFMGIRDFARRHIDELEPATLAVIDGYIKGINAYATLHPQEVLLQAIFPVERYDLVAGYLLGLVEISGASADLAKLANGSIVEELQSGDSRGSNAIAISAEKTVEGQTFLAINSHQPMEGWYSWYEAHLISDEGMNILGGTFPGAATIFHGTNEYLGWAHTVNHADFSDVYKLTMHPEKSEYYEIDGKWYPLEKRVLRSWIKIFGPIKIPITRDIYHSQYGVTFKIGEEFYAWRFQAGEAFKAIEQWYKMSKSKSFDQWHSALSIKGIPCTNIVYADREDNIFYISNARQPKRNTDFDWSGVLPGNVSETLWPTQEWVIDSLPQVKNPASGYVFNTNNTPYSSSSSIDNPVPTKAHSTMGYLPQNEENNRSLRLMELLESKETYSYHDFLRIKYDRTYPTPLKSRPYDEEPLLTQDPSVHPDYALSVQLLNSWDRSTSEKSKASALFLLAKESLRQKFLKNRKIEASNYIESIAFAQEELISNFGAIDIPLGIFQRHRRGSVDIPIGGGADVLAAIYSKKDTDGKYRAYSGESYIQLVRFDSINGPMIESINAFGSSARPENSHYSDQMNLFADQKLKPMYLSLDKVKETAIRKYNPLQVSNE